VYPQSARGQHRVYLQPTRGQHWVTRGCPGRQQGKGGASSRSSGLSPSTAGGGTPGVSQGGEAGACSVALSVPVMILGKVRGRKGRSAKRVGAEWAEQRLREIGRQAAPGPAPQAGGAPPAHLPPSASGVASPIGATPGARLGPVGAPPGARLASAVGDCGEGSGEKGRDRMPELWAGVGRAAPGTPV